jgi:outer membrane protein OmpA-like peptidoglycan-associated protein
MVRSRWVSPWIAITSGLATVAHADPTQLGGFVGPRIFASDEALGYITGAPAHPSLGSALALGGRIARPMLPWLVPELELAFAPTSTTATGGADAATVFWIDPRVHVRFQLSPDRRIQPFFVVGGGAPIALSSARKTFDSGIVGAAYLGGGLRFDTGRGFLLRGDARLVLVPGSRWVDDLSGGSYVRPELDVGIGIELQLGKRRPSSQERAALRDADRDGIPDGKDACADRPEDRDSFEDEDGCPDIDDDGDRVLDIADRCRAEPETLNGFDDDDGCPDAVPPEVDALRGTIEGLVYANGETAVRNTARASLAKITSVLAQHPSLRVVLVGHTDDREAKAFAEPAAGQPAPDVAEIALDLSRARAEAVRQALLASGTADGRIVVEGRGAEEPVADNDRTKGRLANRRVELRLYVRRE